MLARLKDMFKGKFCKLKKEALNYSIRDRQLQKNKCKMYFLCLIFNNLAQRVEVIKELHDKTGHLSQETTFAKLACKYYQEDSYNNVCKYYNSCKVY